MAIASHAGSPVDIAIERTDGKMILSPTPNAAGRIGLAAIPVHHDVPLGMAVSSAFVEPPRFWGAQLKAIVASQRTELSGPVGLLRATTQASDRPGEGLVVGGLVMIGYLWVPFLLALVTFPRQTRKS